MDKLPNHLLNIRCSFDEYEQLMYVPSLFGVLVFNIPQNQITKVIGREERNERFMGVSLYQGKAMADTSGQTGKGGTSSQQKEFDPCMFVTSYKKPRFFIFSKRKPIEVDKKGHSRDVFNEKPLKEDLIALEGAKNANIANKVILCTSMGDIFIRLFTQETPKTCENFINHCKNGYYNSLIFHRVIKGFMIQTGCPNGDGTGGRLTSSRRIDLGRRVRGRVPPIAQAR